MSVTKDSLTGSTALVTGGARRLGCAICLALGSAGANVVVHHHTSASAAVELVTELRTLGVEAWDVEANLSKSGAPEALMTAAASKAGPIDLLVNNASTFTPSRLADFTFDDLVENLRVNAFAPLELMRSVARQDLDEGGIVNMLDTRVWDYDSEHVAYHLAKRALYALTRMAAVEFAPRLRVNAVAPGLVLPPEGEDQSYLDKRLETNPLHRHGSAEEVANAVVHLCASKFVTGEVLRIDGGRHLDGAMY